MNRVVSQKVGQNKRLTFELLQTQHIESQSLYIHSLFGDVKGHRGVR